MTVWRWDPDQTIPPVIDQVDRCQCLLEMAYSEYSFHKSSVFVVAVATCH